MDNTLPDEVETGVRSSSRAAPLSAALLIPTHVTAAPRGPGPVSPHRDIKDRPERVVWGAQLSAPHCDTCQPRVAGWALPAVQQRSDAVDTGAMGHWGRLSELLTSEKLGRKCYKARLKGTATEICKTGRFALLEQVITLIHLYSRPTLKGWHLTNNIPFIASTRIWKYGRNVMNVSAWESIVRKSTIMTGEECFTNPLKPHYCIVHTVGVFYRLSCQIGLLKRLQNDTVITYWTLNATLHCGYLRRNPSPLYFSCLFRYSYYINGVKKSLVPEQAKAVVMQSGTYNTVVTDSAFEWSCYTLGANEILMTPSGTFGRGKVFVGWWSPSCNTAHTYTHTHMQKGVCTDDEDTRAGSDACDHVGGYTLPFSVVLLAEGQEL